MMRALTLTVALSGTPWAGGNIAALFYVGCRDQNGVATTSFALIGMPTPIGASDEATYYHIQKILIVEIRKL